jgi:hypothetical protein
MKASVMRAACHSHQTDPDRLWGPPTLLSDGNRGSFPGLKRPEREVDHSPPSGAERMRGVILPLAHYVFIAWCLIKRRRLIDGVARI